MSVMSKAAGKNQPNKSSRKSDVHDVSTPSVTSDKKHHDLSKCPCGTSSSDNWKIDCSQCKQYWHTDCLGMKGLPKNACNKMLEWRCPFCFVAPVPTKRTDTDLCSMCRNTLTLQQANSDIEVHITTEKMNHLKVLSQSLAGIDIEHLKESISTVQMFDLHLMHLLTDKNGLKSYENSVKKIEHEVASLSTDTKSFASSIESVGNEVG